MGGIVFGVCGRQLERHVTDVRLHEQIEVEQEKEKEAEAGGTHILVSYRLDPAQHPCHQCRWNAVNVQQDVT